MASISGGRRVCVYLQFIFAISFQLHIDVGTLKRPSRNFRLSILFTLPPPKKKGGGDRKNVVNGFS